MRSPLLERPRIHLNQAAADAGQKELDVRELMICTARAELSQHVV